MESRRSIYSSRSRGTCAADVQRAIGYIEGRWKMMIIAHLFEAPPTRFSELERKMPKVSQKMLIQQLRALEQDGIVSRTVYAQVPPKVEYDLTDHGRALEPVFLALLDWAASAG